MDKKTQQKNELLLSEQEIYSHDQEYQDKLFDDGPWRKE